MTTAVARPELRLPPTADSFVPNARSLSISQVIRRLFRMAILFLAARLLGVETFGTYALLLTVVEMISIISGSAYMDFLTREIAKQPDAGWPLGLKITQLRLLYIAPSVGVALLLLMALRFPSSLIVNTALLAITLLPRAVGESAQGVMKGLRRFAPLPWIEFVQGGMVLAFAPALILYGFGVRGLIAAEIMGAIAGVAISLGCVAESLNFTSKSGDNLRAVMRSTFTFNIYPFIGTVYDRVDILLLSKLAGFFATGIYSIPYRAYATLSIIPSSIMGALLPVFSSAGMIQDVRENCSRVMKFLYCVALLIVLATMAFAGPVVLLVLGQSYAGSIAAIKILVWASVPAFLNFALNTLLLAAHKERLFLWTASICTVFNISANLLLIPRFSFIAAAWITVLTELLLLAQNLYLIKKFLGHPVLPRDWVKITVTFAAVFSGFWILRRWVPEVYAGSLACAAFATFVARIGTGFSKLRTAEGHQQIK